MNDLIDMNGRALWPWITETECNYIVAYHKLIKDETNK